MSDVICNADKLIEIQSHGKYIEILRRIQRKTKYIYIFQTPGIDNRNDKIVKNSKAYMTLLRVSETKRFMESKYGQKSKLYEFLATKDFFDYLRTFEAFFISRYDKGGYSPDLTEFGFDDIGFLDERNRVLLHTVTHEGLAFYDEKLIDLNIETNS